MPLSDSKPSLTRWLVTRPLAVVADAALVYRDLITGEQKLPGGRFYRQLMLYCALFALCCIGYVLSPYKMIYNHTPSEKEGWYVMHEISQDEKLPLNSLIVLRYLDPSDRGGCCSFKEALPYESGHQMLKRVEGKPGFTVQTIQTAGKPFNQITSGDYRLNGGPIFEYTSTGNPLTSAYQFPEPTVIPEGKLYVGNQRVNNAFDSRYYGLIDRSQIVGYAEKL